MPTGITLRDNRDVDHILKTYRVTCKDIQGVRVKLTKAHVHSSERLSRSYCTLRCRFSLNRVNSWSSAIIEVPRDPRTRIKESHPRDRTTSRRDIDNGAQQVISSYLRVSDTSSVLRLDQVALVGHSLGGAAGTLVTFLLEDNTMHHLWVRVK